MQYFLLFLGSFLAATVLPFSSEAHLLFLLSEKYDPIVLLMMASLGNTLGGMSSYYLGWLCKWEWIEKYLRIKQSKVESLQLRLKKYGLWASLFCWLPIVGDAIAVALGVFRLDWKKVLVLMFVGKFIRYVIIVFAVELF